MGLPSYGKWDHIAILLSHDHSQKEYCFLYNIPCFKWIHNYILFGKTKVQEMQKLQIDGLQFKP